MKLTCSKDLLLQYINIVNKAVSNRTTLPILECILLTANERGFIMTGNDLEIGIRTAPIEAEIQEAGEVAIEARIFNEIVRRLNGESVTIATDEDYAVTIVSGSSEFKIMGQSGEDFPTPAGGGTGKAVFYGAGKAARHDSADDFLHCAGWLQACTDRGII